MKPSEDMCRLLRRAIALWGAPAQWDQAIEECSEFITAALHHRRKRANVEAVAEEIADALICLQQAREMIGPAIVDSFVEQKLERLERRVTFHEQRKAGGEFVTPYDDGTDGTEPRPDVRRRPP